MKKIKKLILITFLILLIAIISIGTFAGNLLYNIAIDSNFSKNTIYAEYVYKDTYSDKTWLLQRSNYTDEYINSFDNFKLHAYMIKQKKKTSKWVVIAHGYGEEGKLMSINALHFYSLGYNVLIPDLRGSGKSEGDYIGMGWYDRLDICDWIDRIVDDDPNSKIALFGISMGGSTILMSSGEDLPSNVKCIISDCAYTSAYDVFGYELNTYLNTPSFPVVDFTNLVTILRAGYALKDASAIEQVKKSKTPTLFIHGDSDKIVPSYMMDELYNAATCEKEKLLVKDGEHAGSDLADFNAYWDSIKSFLKKHID